MCSTEIQTKRLSKSVLSKSLSLLDTMKEFPVCLSMCVFAVSHLGPGEFGGEEEDDGKANLRGSDGTSPESTRSGMPGDVLTVSVTTSSGSKTNSSS